MLVQNIGIMDRKHEILKLKDMIDEEEYKLKSARGNFLEESGKFK